MISNILLTAAPLVPLYFGIYLVFLMRNDFDLSLEGTFAVGGAATAALVTQGVSGWAAMPAAVVICAALGLVTATIHARLRIPVFLAGLVMSIALYSVALRIMDKQPTLSILGEETVLSRFDDLSGTSYDVAVLLLLGAIVVVALVLVAVFLGTELGLALRTAGINPKMARSNGFNDKTGVAMALVIANGLAGLSGSLIVQTQGFADVGMGRGIVISGLGGVVLGTLLLRPSSSKLGRVFLAVVVGTVAYQAILIIALRMGLDPVDLNLITAATLVVAIAIQLGVRNATARGRRNNRDATIMREGTGTDLVRALSGKG